MPTAARPARPPLAGRPRQGRRAPQLQRRGAGGLPRRPAPRRAPLRTRRLRQPRRPRSHRSQADGLLPRVQLQAGELRLSNLAPKNIFVCLKIFSLSHAVSVIHSHIPILLCCDASSFPSLQYIFIIVI